jgi:TRAP-type C4-dicarboxylate transport system substrate-binding protein
VGNPVSDLVADWGKEVEKRTNGALTFTMFPGGTLTPADKCYDGVVKGISGMGSAFVGFTKGRFPLMEVLDLPLGFRSARAALHLCQAIKKKFPLKEFDDTKLMYFQAGGPSLLHSKKPVRKLEDLKGMKIRSMGTTARIVSALGGTPVALPMGDLYDALAKGVVDAAIAPTSALEGFRWGEVVKYTIEDWGAANSAALFVVMNKKIWSSLPADVQQTIEKVNEEWIDKTAKVWEDYDKLGVNFAAKLGNQTISLTKEENERWAQRARPTLDDYVDSTKKRGLPGDQVLQFAIDFLKNQ